MDREVHGKLAELPCLKGCDQQHEVQLEGSHYWSTAGVYTGPMLFNIFINYLDDGTECILNKFAGGARLGGMADALEGCAAIQRDLDRLQKWANRSLIMFSRGNAVLHLERNNLGEDQLEYSFAEKVMGILTDTKLNTS